jgi:hypothetical protein
VSIPSADGIPDCWERWTRTKPLIADANLDPDGDGVDNFGEFWNQCDPLMKGRTPLASAIARPQPQTFFQ